MKPGPKRILCLAACLLIGLVALFVWKAWRPSEPVYQGKTLSAWVEQWQSNRIALTMFFDNPSRKAATYAREEAQKAILQIGTNGIPYLLRLVRSEELATPSWLKRTLPDSWLERLGLEDAGGKINQIGSHGLYILGTNASPAVPALMDLLSAELARSPIDTKRIWLVMSPLSSMKDGADPAIPLLIECLTHTNRLVGREAARSLSRFYDKPEIVVPALVNFLTLQNKSQQPDRLDEEETIISIGLFGTNAASAAPALIGYLTDPDPAFREAATNWLRRVDPSAAERAGIRIYKTR